MARNLRFVLVAFFLVPASFANGGQLKLAKHPDVSSNLALLEAWVESQMSYKGLPGMSVAIVHDQEILWSRGFGHADVALQSPATSETIYRIASHSKLFTAIAIMQLRDAGKLHLNDPVSKHLPWFKIQGLKRNTPPVTIQHLLTHSSGLPREAKPGYWGDFDFPTIDEVKRLLPAQEAVYPAETRWKYSNLALVLAGEIVSTVSGQSYAEYVEQKIFQPLGMDSTSVVLDSEQRKRLAAGYGHRMPDGTRHVFPYVDIKGLAAAGGVSSSVADMARFVSWQFRLRASDKTEVLAPSTLKEMQRIHWLDDGWKSGWGLGFHIVRQEERTLIGHDGSYPGYLTATYISPAEKLGVIVFTNSLDAQPYPGQPLSVVDRAVEWLGPAVTNALKRQQFQSRIRIAGRYSPRRSLMS